MIKMLHKTYYKTSLRHQNISIILEQKEKFLSKLQEPVLRFQGWDCKSNKS